SICVILSPLTVRSYRYNTGRPPPLPLFPYTTLFRSTIRLSSDSSQDHLFQRDHFGAANQEGEGQSALPLFILEKIMWIRSTEAPDRKSTRLNSSHVKISYAVFCLIKNTKVRSVDAEL